MKEEKPKKIVNDVLRDLAKKKKAEFKSCDLFNIERDYKKLGLELDSDEDDPSCYTPADVHVWTHEEDEDCVERYKCENCDEEHINRPVTLHIDNLGIEIDSKQLAYLVDALTIAIENLKQLDNNK